jgi:hypothetical protein
VTVEIVGTLDWQHCPVCGSDRIEGHTVEVDGTSAWQPVTCRVCGSDWNEVYEAVGRDNINKAFEGSRYWVDDNIDYTILLDGQDTEYVGLVDEVAGGHIAYGPRLQILSLVNKLNACE